jgi:transposase
VLSDVFGVSGQLMLEALLKGTSDPAEIAAFAKKKAKQKMPEIMAALQENSMSDHHRLMIRFSVAHLEFLEKQILAFDEEIRKKIIDSGYVKEWELLRSLTAVDENAATILAEMGPDPAQFPSEKHLGSWSALCPGNNRSAVRSKTSHTKDGNPWLRSGALPAKAIPKDPAPSP